MLLDDFPAGPFTTSHARELGFSQKQLGAAVREGVLRRVLRGVYLRHDQPDTVETRAACAALVIAAGSVVRDRTAAWIHGIDVFTYPSTTYFRRSRRVSAGSRHLRGAVALMAAHEIYPPKT